jgi:RNA-directed DNA polymerase
MNDAPRSLVLSSPYPFNQHLVRWAMHKFKRFRGKYAKAMAWLQKVYQFKPGLFAHWQLIAFT